MQQTAGSRPIALLTDFGHTDPFAGILKGVILSVNPQARIVDLCHGIGPQDIAHGAFVLETSLKYFPEGTIFCTVVDPGVGSSRRAVLVKTADYFLVGPDNGVLWPAARKNTIKKVVNLTSPIYFLSSVSSTFHGRDIFAPVAAHLSAGTDPAAFGPEISDLTILAAAGPEPFEAGLVLTVNHIDTFGNIGLNLGWERFKPFCDSGFCLTVNQVEITRYYESYAMAPENTPFVLKSSTGYMEIAVKNRHAAKMLGVSQNDKIILHYGADSSNI
ncbi:MAG: SAM-dependent chlorinase/fluorinase [Desulfotignum sp.]|nr:SAM-dependent chlorinase/fluorinase [Desulfotignum sp.]MCF8126022.1 SAM-dependent chlorinase/fluorinase [Desulfotignum sp.]